MDQASKNQRSLVAPSGREESRHKNEILRAAQDDNCLGEAYVIARRLKKTAGDGRQAIGIFRFIKEGKDLALVIECMKRLEERVKSGPLAGLAVKYLRGTLRRLEAEREAKKWRKAKGDGRKDLVAIGALLPQILRPGNAK